MAGPRFFGFVIGGSLPVTLAANWLAGAWDQNPGLYAPTPATARLEEVALRWLLDLFRLPSECGGAFVTGATMANFSALAAARHAVLQKAGWNVEAEGCAARRRLRWSLERKRVPHFSSPWGFWDWAGIESLQCQSIHREGCVRTHCRL
jgi:Pyridoxal-dependent decarboxylase conserved domain